MDERKQSSSRAHEAEVSSAERSECVSERANGGANSRRSTQRVDFIVFLYPECGGGMGGRGGE